MHSASDTDSLWTQMFADIKFALSCTSSTKEVRKRASVSIGLSASEEERMATYASDSAIMNSIGPNAIQGPSTSQLRSNVMGPPQHMLSSHPVGPCDVCYAASSVITGPSVVNTGASASGAGGLGGSSSAIVTSNVGPTSKLISTLPPPMHPPPNPPTVNAMADLDMDSSTMSSSMRGNSPPPFGEIASTSLFLRSQTLHTQQHSQEPHC